MLENLNSKTAKLICISLLGFTILLLNCKQRTSTPESNLREGEISIPRESSQGTFQRSKLESTYWEGSIDPKTFHSCTIITLQNDTQVRGLLSSSTGFVHGVTRTDTQTSKTKYFDSQDIKFLDLYPKVGQKCDFSNVPVSGWEFPTPKFIKCICEMYTHGMDNGLARVRETINVPAYSDPQCKKIIVREVESTADRCSLQGAAMRPVTPSESFYLRQLRNPYSVNPGELNYDCKAVIGDIAERCSTSAEKDTSVHKQ